MGERVKAQTQKELRLWYNLNSLIYDQKGSLHFEGSNDSVFGDSCQRGRKYEPRAKGPHHHQFQKFSAFQEYLSIGILLCSKEGESSISKMMYQNPLEH